MMKKTLFAMAVSATLFSLEASANNNVRANGATSATTLPSVGHRPVATAHNGKDLEVSGTLITGEVLTINKFFITDVDGDGEGTDKKEANLNKTITDVVWKLIKDGSETQLAIGTQSLTIPAEAAGGKIQVTYTVRTSTGTPDTAILPSSIILTPANSGATVAPGGNVDGTVSAKLANVVIDVLYTTTGAGQAPSDDINGTDEQGTPVVGSTLKATLTCTVQSDCDNPETRYDFQWSMGDSASGPFSTKLGSGQTHQVHGSQQGKYFSVDVTPKKNKSDAPLTRAKRR